MSEKSALLALEFSGKHSSVALAVAAANTSAANKATFFQRSSEGPRGRFLLQEVDQLLEQAELPRECLGGIVAGIGPGSYTGLRIACAAAHALGFALDIPYAGICSFEAALFAAPQGSTVHIVQDAYRKEAYYACGQHQMGEAKLSDGPRVIAIDQIPTAVADQEAFLICDERLSGKLAKAEDALLKPQAVDLLKIAMQRGVNAHGEGWDSLAAAEPMYLRAAAFRQ